MSRIGSASARSAGLARRSLLSGLGAAPFMLGSLWPRAARADNRTTRENDKPGNWDWYLEKPRRKDEIEGYASATSVAQGESFDLFVNVSEAQTVGWKAYRLGYYQGIGARQVAAGGPTALFKQDKFVVGSNGLIECQWRPSFRITTGEAWPSGLYLINLTRADGYQARVPIIVREPVPLAPLLFKASVTTWQAYNLWGGASLYVNDPEVTELAGPRAARVSFDRPYHDRAGAGQLLSYESWMAQWLEGRGYEVGYVTNIDLDATPSVLDRRKMILSVGHDEYWTSGERDTLEAARAEGISLAFFSGNTGYWRIRYENSEAGGDRRVMVCYKDAEMDPVRNSPNTTVLFRSAPDPRPEHSLLGVMYGGWTLIDGFPMIVKEPDHWVYAGTNVQAGDMLSHIVGYEWDYARKDKFAPPGLEILASTDAISYSGESIPSHMSIYRADKGNIVFSAGTIEWPWGLSLEGYADPRIQRITENVLAAAGIGVPEFTSVSDPAPPLNPGQASVFRTVAGSEQPGYADGALLEAKFNSPAGVAAAADGTIYLTEVRNHTVRVIRPDGTVGTLAGCGPFDSAEAAGYKDGIGLEACFNVPTGIAVDSHGLVYVSDTGNHVIRRIDPVTAKVETYAGRTWNGGHRDARDRREALFNNPRGLAMGPDDILYVADCGSNAIRRIGREGVETVADGLYHPTGVAAGPNQTVYAIDTGSARIVRIPPRGKLETIAGGRFGDASGPASRARFRPFEGLVWSPLGLVFSDSANHRIRVVSLEGDRIVSTLAGDGRHGAGEGAGDSFRVALPRGLARHGHGFIAADSANHRIIYFEP